MVVVMAKEQWGKMAGREKELKHGDHSFTRQLESALVSATRVQEAQAEGLAVAAPRLAC